MKKTFIVLFIIIFTLSGCFNASKEPVPEPVVAVTKNSSPEEISANNTAISDEDVTLIQFQEPSDDMVKATIKTSEGDIKVVLFQSEAPFAVSKFIENAETGVYKNSTFHKIMENFYIETTAVKNLPERDEKNNPVKKDDETAQVAPIEVTEATPEGSEAASEGVGVESSLDLWHFRGALAMRENTLENPTSDMSTFFIVQALILPEETIGEMEKVGFPTKVVHKYEEIGGIPSYDSNFTVFGHVYEGLDIVDKITNVRVKKDYYPENPITIEDVIIEHPATQTDSE